MYGHDVLYPYAKEYSYTCRSLYILMLCYFLVSHLTPRARASINSAIYISTIVWYFITIFQLNLIFYHVIHAPLLFKNSTHLLWKISKQYTIWWLVWRNKCINVNTLLVEAPLFEVLRLIQMVMGLIQIYHYSMLTWWMPSRGVYLFYKKK